MNFLKDTAIDESTCPACNVTIYLLPKGEFFTKQWKHNTLWQAVLCDSKYGPQRDPY